MYELRWKLHTQGPPPQGSVMYGNPGQGVHQYLQYRTICNPEEVGIHEPIWGEWENVPMA